VGATANFAPKESKRRHRRSVPIESVAESSAAAGEEPKRKPKSDITSSTSLFSPESGNDSRHGKAKMIEPLMPSSQTRILRTGIALKDFKAKESRELNIKKGELIVNLEPDSWYGQSEKGIRGGFAGTYVQIIDENDFSKGAVAIRDCRYHNFRAGDFLSDLTLQPDGSYFGRNERGIRGKFPGSYAQLVDHRDITKGAFALQDYRFQNFQKGEKITDLRLTWWRGVNPKGEVGCIPDKLVEVIEQSSMNDVPPPPPPPKDYRVSKTNSSAKQSVAPEPDPVSTATPISISIPCITPNDKKWIYTLHDSVDISVGDMRVTAAQYLDVEDTNRVRLFLDDFALHHDTWRIPSKQLAEMCYQGTKVYIKRSDYLLLRYGDDVHVLRFEVGSIERGILFMSRVRDEAAVVMGKGFRSYPKESMRLTYLGNELSRNMPVSRKVREEGLTVGAEIVCELLYREDRKQYIRDCDREVDEWGVHPKTQDCSVCGDEKIIRSEFPNKITEKCRHEVHTCKECLQRWITSQLDSTSWDRIHCPECKLHLKHNDVQKYAEKEVFLRYVEFLNPR
jgi:hypothetical protein